LIELIQDPEVLRFIRDHQSDNPESILLAGKKYPGIPLKFVVTQIKARQKSREKLPFVSRYPGFVFPSLKSYEQSSSETTAKYKSGLYNGKTLLDLSGGLGIDSLFFSDQFEKVTYVEKDSEIAEAARYNFNLIGRKNIEVFHYTAEDFLNHRMNRYDLVYLDPARRDEQGKRLFLLEDCQPNIFDLLPKLFQHTGNILLKTAPLLDIKSVLAQLSIPRVDVVAVENECKEVLFHISKEKPAKTEIHTINHRKKKSETFSFNYTDENEAKAKFSEPMQFLYEPNAAILKAGAFKSIAIPFDLYKLHEHTHLYTGDSLIRDFPGRIFRVLDQVSPNRKKLKKIVPEMKANLSVRNFPISVANLKKKLGLNDGGKLFIFGLKTIPDKNTLVTTERISD
jgi:hypothetical protein